MTVQARCTACRGYFPRHTFFYHQQMTRICTEQCFNEWTETRRRKAKANRKKPRKRTIAPKIPIDVRMAVHARDKTCRMCGSSRSLHCHHVQYRAQGGPDVEENLVLLCAEHHELVHSDKRVYQPLLQTLLRLEYVEHEHLTVPEVVRRAS